MKAKKPAVKLGAATVNEIQVLTKLADLKAAVIKWAKSHQLWHDANFHTPFVHKDAPPERHCALLLTFDGPLINVFNSTHEETDKLQVQFDALLEKHGFWSELENHYTLSIIPADEKYMDELLMLHRWQWIQHLATQRLFDVHSEVFEHFAKYPDHLYRLEWRQYEVFLDTVFRNQGFRTELGPGSNDEGIDIRLYQSQSLPQLVAVVQAKKFHPDLPIKLDTVAALFGHAVLHKAHKGILATTSRFQPAVKKFAETVASQVDLPAIDLVDSKRVGGWCADIAVELDSYFNNGQTPAPPIITTEHLSGLTGKIVVASGGYDMVINYFARIVADFPYEVVLESLMSSKSSPDGQQGWETALTPSPPGLRFTAFKKTYDDGRISFWGGERLYSLWDGSPQYFDYCD
jgi:restriction system protein